MNKVLHYDGGSSDKVYVGSIVEKADGKFHVIATWGKRGKAPQGTQEKGAYPNRSTAVRELEDLLGSKRKKGYIDIDSNTYTGSVRMTDRWLQSWLQEDMAAPASTVVPKTGEEVAKVLSDSVKNEAIELLKKGLKINAVKKIRDETGCLLQPAKEYMEDILEPEVNRAIAMAPAVGERDFEVVCVNNLGLEEYFDEGVTYIAESHSEKDYIYVWDRGAKKQEVFAERFKNAKAEAIA